jgi:large subunit ribosomal protein L9
MEVILKQDVDRLGRSGAIVKVKNGYARNFLIPSGLAIPVTARNIKLLEEGKQRRALQLENIRKEAEELKLRLEKFSLTIPAQAYEQDKLYGSISQQDIVDALKEEGFDIDKNSVILDEPIRSLGIYEVNIKLYQEIFTKIKVWVVKK